MNLPKGLSHYELEPFTYCGIDFTGHAFYSRAKDTIEYTLYSSHGLSKVKFRNDWELPLETVATSLDVTEEEAKKFLETNIGVFPEEYKEELIKNLIWEFEEAWILMVCANTNYYSNEYSSNNRNDFWPIMTKESVEEYYKRFNIEPVLNFDGSYNSSSFSVDPIAPSDPT
ncbi:hypothetical protein SEA_WEASELS2_261 [Rhodococcus phage Weasels2]|uniref:Uncharacterized protein n=1 Tax=Rhodococcus phage Weasels2 TaxID=1897437 RepID=A0A1I9SAN3_9CAUD|nr:hypothetical protein FDH04_gp155 [Rhodococcus phage Weasels2]AOZ63839.1 hypothetical protein SEA_WEASELS2_261 [Rhodococcus phage Weasels2]